MIFFYIFLLYFYPTIKCDSLSYLYHQEYIEVPIDHFSFCSNATFKLRYLYNDSHYIKGGPIFLYTGNEEAITKFAENTGFLYDIAPKFNALIVFGEHRYYGASLPFGNQSFSSPQHLGYLTASQALEDFVYLVDVLKAKYFRTMISNDTYPVIAFGGSYGGMLAAWLRMKYPESVLGAIASSAPLQQFFNMVECDAFYQATTKVFSNCSAQINSTWSVIRNLSKTEDGRRNITTALKLCKNITTETDANAIVEWLSDIYAVLAMSNYPYPTDFIVPLPANPVTVFCETLLKSHCNNSVQLLTALGNALGIYTNFTGKTACNNFNTSRENLVEYAWNFQACTELIMPICSTNKDMFENAEWNFKNFSDDCFKTYGVIPLRPDLPILEFGGRNLKYASNIVFSNGLSDPWSTGGILKNVSDSVVAVIIPGAPHHVDLRAAMDSDSNCTKKARIFHENMIRKWLNIV